MSWERYWDGDSSAVRFYREADRLSSKKKDYELWLQGRYVYDAMLAAAPPFQTFSKTHRPHKYVEKPYTQAAEDKERENTLEKRLENGRELAERLRDQMNRWKEKNKPKQ